MFRSVRAGRSRAEFDKEASAELASAALQTLGKRLRAYPQALALRASRSVQTDGAFIELALASRPRTRFRMSWSKRIANPAAVNVGDTVDVEVLGVDPEGAAHQPRHDADSDEPMAALRDRYESAARQGARPQRTTFGLFEVEDAGRARSRLDISWNNASAPRRSAQKGQEIEAVYEP